MTSPSPPPIPPSVRRLVFVLGDQLDRSSPALEGLDPERDVVLMAEVGGEAELFPNHRQRIALFFAAMRHFRADLEARGVPVVYRGIDGTLRGGSGLGDGADREAFVDDLGGADGLARVLEAALDHLAPERVVLVEPGRHGLERELEAVAEGAGVEIDVLADDHFLVSRDEFADWASGRKSLVLETFYRWMRKRTGILMDDDGEPAGGEWNYDKDNRESFGEDGPGEVPAPARFEPDELTREVLEEVAERFAEFPGSLDGFAWPVTPEQAEEALERFVAERLEKFGPYQDALWTGRAWLWHSHLAAAMNLKLLDPRRVIERVVEAWEAGRAPIQSVEGFVRQVLGWREFLRGVYFLHVADPEEPYMERNALGADRPLPEFYWSGDTDMRCVSEVVGQLLETAYAHHIQRLMVTGLFALLYGVEPRQVHDWYMALYVDSVEWVTAPNTIGMSQYADGGVVATKPYIASGKYVDRMSNYCGGCPYDPGAAVGDDACPLTTLYWDFLARHRERFESHHRMALQVRNLERKDAEEVEAIRRRAEALRSGDERL